MVEQMFTKKVLIASQDREDIKGTRVTSCLEVPGRNVV